MKFLLATMVKALSGHSLDQIGLPFLEWLDLTVIPEAQQVLEEFSEYIERWRTLLESEDTFMEKVA